jgi:hypothetical protein
MFTYSGRFTPNHGGLADDTPPPPTSPHAGFLRACARNVSGKGQGGGTQKRDVEIVVGPNGPTIRFRKDKYKRREE